VSITTDLDAIRARWEVYVEHYCLEDYSTESREIAAVTCANDVPFLLNLVDELRRQVKVWKGKAE
jgi:hypothetical protein